jgi:hypothetical protein
MGMLFGLIMAVIVVAGLVVLSSAMRRAEKAERRADALGDRNLRLERAVGVAEQALRALANDTRLDAGMAVEIDTALADVRRASRDEGPSLGR